LVGVTDVGGIALCMGLIFYRWETGGVGIVMRDSEELFEAVAVREAVLIDVYTNGLQFGYL